MLVRRSKVTRNGGLNGIEPLTLVIDALHNTTQQLTSERESKVGYSWVVTPGVMAITIQATPAAGGGHTLPTNAAVPPDHH